LSGNADPGRGISSPKSEPEASSERAMDWTACSPAREKQV
jgi:hypothetical protein